MAKKKRARIALARWHASFERYDPIDVVLDACATLEAALGISSELRIRLAAAVHSILDRERGIGFRATYRMYEVRSRFVHGGGIPSIEDGEDERFREVVAAVLLNWMTMRQDFDPKQVEAHILKRFH